MTDGAAGATPEDWADAEAVAARVRTAVDGYLAMRTPEQRSASRKAVALG